MNNYFTTFKINHHIYQIKDAMGVLTTLIIGKEKALFYEGYYQSYEGDYPSKWLSKIDEAAKKFNLLKTGGLDSHGKDVISRCPYS